MLSEILKLLKERGPMSLRELSISLGTDLSAMEGMLDTLRAKGRVERIQTKCSNCKGCIEVKREDALIFKVV
ncbi:MAG TPA: FeoC-like transcriptional regulator [Tichowtungia sp.]|nr:FeoC-like transcriptional regulator [Tichowtungia sp.]